MSIKQAKLDHPVHDLVARRTSPYAFDPKPVDPADLASLFEAARWAASSYNEQPWRFVVATKEDPAAYAQLLSCLVEGNRLWATHAPVLALGIAKLQFVRNGKPNKAAIHDLGGATAQLTFEATARGLAVHPMIGIDPDRARSVYAIPEDAEALTGIAIGYAGTPDQAPEAVRSRDEAPRDRKPLSEIVFAGRFDQAADLG